MGLLIVRLGDGADHGGAVATASGNWKCEGQPIARDQDIFNCAIHGPSAIIASGKWTCNGRKIARHGDKTACGATLISGATHRTCE